MTDMATLGCGIGTHDANTPGAQDGLVILDFGKPTNNNGELGVSGMYVNGHVNMPTIVELVKEVADFYRSCSAADPSSHLRIGIGTSNYGSNVTYAHGAAWANVVNQVNNWLISKGYFARVDAYGASDLELSWNTPSVTINWVNGYDSANLYPLINFGAAEGCPTRLDPTLNCSNGWTSEQRWYISYGVG